MPRVFRLNLCGNTESRPTPGKNSTGWIGFGPSLISSFTRSPSAAEIQQEICCLPLIWVADKKGILIWLWAKTVQRRQPISSVFSTPTRFTRIISWLTFIPPIVTVLSVMGTRISQSADNGLTSLGQFSTRPFASHGSSFRAGFPPADRAFTVYSLTPRSL